MPVVLTFDIKGAGPQERNRIQSFFERLGWQNLGGSSYRYPKLGTKQPVEDWFNHVVPALMLFRAYVRHSQRSLTKFTLDVQSSVGFDSVGKYGAPPENASSILRPPAQTAFGKAKLVDWLDGVVYPY